MVETEELPEKNQQEQANPKIASQSGGVKLEEGSNVTIGSGDVVGGDKLQAGGHIIQVSSGATLNLFLTEPLSSNVLPAPGPTFLPVSLRRTEQKEHTENQIRNLVANLGVVPEIVDALFADEPPLLPKVLATRNQLVQEIINQIQQVAWLSLTGATGLGKTLLALLVYDKHTEGRVVWITLRGGEDLALKHILKQLLRLITVSQEAEESLQITTWLKLVAQTLGQKALVIIDDLPALETKSPLLSFLANFAHLLRKNNSVLLSTSQSYLPVLVSAQLGEKFAEIAVPPLEPIDVKSLLDALHAPAGVNNEKIVAWICGANSGHPALISATISWLQSIQWNLTGESVDQLITGDPAKRVREDIAKALPRLITNEATREFVYRLSLMSHPFDGRLAKAVAQVAPPILMPGEKLIELHGPWLSRVGKNLYEVSALLRETGVANLSKQLQEAIHSVCADQLLLHSPISADQVFNISIHLFSSNQGDRLATFLVQALANVNTRSQAEYFSWATFLLSNDALKRIELSPYLIVMVRAVQARLRLLASKDALELLTDVDARISKLDLTEEKSALAALFAYANTGPFIDSAQASLGVLQAVKLSRVLKNYPESLALIPSFPAPPQQMIWFPLMRIPSFEEYVACLEVVETLQNDELEGFVSGALSEEAIQLWVDRAWLIVDEQSKESADWVTVLQIINRIKRVGQRANQPSLVIAASRASAIVYADHLKQVDDALQVLENAPEAPSPTYQFILAYTAASILLDASRLQEALAEYEQASGWGADTFEYYRFDTFRRVAEIHARMNNWVASAGWWIKAIRYARQHESIPVEDHVELLAELAWVRWNEGKRRKVAGAMFAAVMWFLQVHDASNPRHKETMFKIGHVLGWLVYVVNGGKAPELTAYGEPYMSPFPGMVSRRREKISKLDRPGFVWTLLLQLAYLAEGVGLRLMAFYAYNLAYEQVVAQGLAFQSAIIDLHRTKLAAMFLPPDQAVNIALSGIEGLAVGKPLLSASNVATLQIDVQPTWSRLPEETRLSAKRHCFWTSFGIAISYLLEKGVSEGLALQRLDEWRVALSDRFSDDKAWWMNLADAARFIFQPSQARDVIKAKIGELSSDDVALKILLYLALSAQLDTSLDDVANAQAIVYQFLLNPKSGANEMRPGIGALIVRTWKYIVEKRGFYLSAPIRLRKTLAEAHNPPAEVEVAKILIAAANSVGTRYPDEVERTFSGLLAAD